MLNIPPIKRLPKDEYFALRKAVRKNIALNSQQATLRKLLVGGAEILMGGMVIKKTRLVNEKFGNEKMSISVSLPQERADEGYQDNLKSNSGLEEISETAEFLFVLYDFSGVFDVRVFWGEDKNRDLMLRASRIKEGDVVYVVGSFVPINGPEKYFIIPSEIFYEDELKLCDFVDVEKLKSIRKSMQEIKNLPIPPERIRDILNYSDWNPYEILRLFLPKDNHIGNFDYYKLVDCLYGFYSENPSLKLANLIVKYYKKYGQSQVCECADNVQNYFFNLCPELKGVVELDQDFISKWREYGT
jgi:hypothetical protein